MAALYALGSNGSGQLGIGHSEDVSVPKPVLFKNACPDGLTHIRAGGNHTLLSSGTLHCSGDSSTGACGLKPDATGVESHFDEAHLFSEGSSKPRAAFCAATWEASIVVLQDENGRATRVHAFGTGNKGELGLGELIFRSSKAQLIKNFPPDGTEVLGLAASMSHVVVVLDNGDVYGWGSGRKGQLGQPEEVVHSPRKIEGVNFKVLRAVCGREFTCLLGEKGAGEHAILGSDKNGIRSTAPQNVAGWKDIGSTWGSIFVLHNEGHISCWGRDDHGQLAPQGLPPLSQIACGSEHVLGLTVDGDVLAWGWGEHGNCGPNTIEGDVKGKWNVIASSKYLSAGTKISTIGAGCATSWIYITI